MKVFHQVFLSVVLTLSSLGQVAQGAIDPGRAYFERGQFELAVQAWAEALSKTSPEKKPEQYIDTSIYLAAAYQALGHVNKACDILESLLPLAENDPERKAKVLMHLGNVYLAMRDFQDREMSCNMRDKITNRRPVTQKEIMGKALYYIQQAENTIILIDSQKIRYPVLWANILNSKGNVLTAQKQYADALKIYEESVELADKGSDKLLSAMASINIFEAVVQNGDYEKIEVKVKSELELETILHRIQESLDSYDKVFALIRISQLMLRSLESKLEFMSQKARYTDEREREWSWRKLSPHVYKYAHSALIKAREIAINQGNYVAMAYAELYFTQLPLMHENYLKQRYIFAKEYNNSKIANIAKTRLEELTTKLKKERYYKNNINLMQKAIRYVQSYPSILMQKASSYVQSYPSISTTGRQIKHADGFVSSTRYNVYSPSFFEQDTVSKKECEQSCQNSPFPFSKHLSKKCRGTCQLLSPLYLKNYHPELLFRLERQLGILWGKQRELQKAIDSYKRAIEHLQFFRESRNISQSFFNMAEKASIELVDLLLQQAAKAPKESIRKQDLLRDAIDKIESFKKVELQNYFQDVCITEGLQNTINLDHLPDNVAVFYPLLLDDRVELLVISNNGIQQKHPSPEDKISVGELKVKVDSFLKTDLKEGRSSNFKPKNAQYIYNGIIKPIIDLAQQVDTLIVVPDATLRTIPFAALHDGNKFLVQEKFSLVVTPSIKLTVYGKMQRDNVWALLNGSKTFWTLNGSKIKKVALPLECVPMELCQVSYLLKDNTFIKDEEFAFRDTSTCALKNSPACLLGSNKISLLLDEDFILSNVKERLDNTPYSIVHFATHGVFESGNETFLRTYDDKIRMSELKTLIRDVEKKFGYQPIELLTLSACQTATGDKRAVLGLAGAAIQTGVPSVLATLWNVTDPATAQLISEFYRQLRKKPDFSKAKALQEAQKRLLNRVETKIGKDKKEEKGVEYHPYKRPYFWAPFLLIGNWL